MNYYIGIPAYNCQDTILDVIEECRKYNPKNIIVVNDGSTDNTSKLLNNQQINEQIIKIDHKKNKGYGGSQKTIYRKFLKVSNDEDDVMILMHSDGQTLPEEIPRFVEEFKNKDVDVVLGSRKLGNQKVGGMPIYRIFGDSVLTNMQNYCFDLNLSTYASGYRAFRKNVLNGINFNLLSDNHKIDTEILLAIKDKEYRMIEIPVKTVYDGEKSNYNLVKYSLGVMWLALMYKLGFKKVKEEQSPDYYHNLYYNSGIHSYINQKRVNSVLEYLENDSTVLDAGCGSGVLSNIVSGTVLGVDANEQVIDYAKKNSKGEFICQDLMSLSLDKKFDNVVCLHTLEHFVKEDRKKVMDRLDQHLKSGGKMILAVPSIFFMKFLEKPFQLVRSVFNPNTKFDDQDIHEKVYLQKEIKQMKGKYKILDYGTNCFLTNSFIVLRKHK